MAKVKSCGFLIYRDPHPDSITEHNRGNQSGKRQLLLMKHANRWDLPKGHVDPGETNLQAALRELKEETGIQPDDIEIDSDFKFKLKYNVRYNKKFGGKSVKKKLIIYLAKLVNDVPIQPTEHEDFQWMDWNPPHVLQKKTIDPLLAKLTEYWLTEEPETVEQEPVNP